MSKSRASSPGVPAAAIQLAESLTSPIFSIRAAAMLESASPTAMRPEAGASSTATGVRSPSAKASPRSVRKPIVVTATSATGVCHGPTIWSRAVRPPTERSPIEIRKVLLATAGRRNTRQAASARSIAAMSSGTATPGWRVTSRVMRGGLPSSASMSISTGLLPKWRSLTISRFSSVATPTTAKGQRSRSQNA